MTDLITVDPAKVEATRAHGTQVVQWAESLTVKTEKDFKEAQSALIVVRDGKKKVTNWIKGILDPFAEAVKNAKANLSPLLEPYSHADEVATKKMQSYVDAERERAQKAAEDEKRKREAEVVKNKARMNALLGLGFKWKPEDDMFIFGAINVRTVEIAKDSDELWNRKMQEIAEEVAHIKATDPQIEAKELEVPSAPLPELSTPKPIEQPNFTVKTEQGTAYTRKSWTFDENEIDLNLIPREYLKLDEVKVNGAIKAGMREIAGLKIFEKETIVTRS